ncbi:hypothetical protein ACF07T_36570 [Streptomyces sp. NPDC015184]|uniref:hypothetical protein n=1 Tax=Streptomyces sp. NPDC015184 TaxID=3364946 RepID=UPI0036FB8F8F
MIAFRPMPGAGPTARQRGLAAHGRSLFARLATAAGVAFDDAGTAVVLLDDAVRQPRPDLRGGLRGTGRAPRTVRRGFPGPDRADARPAAGPTGRDGSGTGG